MESTTTVPARTDGTTRRRIDPLPSPATGRVSPSAAAIARPLLVLLPVVTFLIPTLFVALTRPPTHTSDARLLVGGFDVEAQAIPGFVEASQTLASTYARLVGTPAIAKLVAEDLGTSVGEVSGHIHATAVPESSLIKIEGTADNARDAGRFAAAAATALVEYASGTGDKDAASQVLEDYRTASAELAAAQRNLERFDAAVDGSSSPSASLLEDHAKAQADVNAAQLKADRLAGRYESAAGGSTGNVQIVAPAADAGDNRSSMVQLAVAGSVGLGLVAGIALATAVVNQRNGATAANSRRTAGPSITLP